MGRLANGETGLFLTSPQKGRWILTIVGDPVDKKYFMFEEGMYFSVFYCLYFVKDGIVDMLEKKLRK